MEPWNKIYQAGQQFNIWPWSDLVSLFHQYKADFDVKQLDILELGAGVGNNAPIFLRDSHRYFAIEQSEFGVQEINRRFPENAHNVLNLDFSELRSLPQKFHIIIDRAAVTHNSCAAITKVLESCHSALEPGGVYIGVDWFSRNHEGMDHGSEALDQHTFNKFSHGQFRSVGTTHFTDEPHLREHFRAYELLHLSEKVVTSHLFEGGKFASWNLVAKKNH